jgi:hypothetical protein
MLKKIQSTQYIRRKMSQCIRPSVAQLSILIMYILQYLGTIVHLREQRNPEYFAGFGIFCAHFLGSSKKELPRHVGEVFFSGHSLSF